MWQRYLFAPPNHPNVSKLEANGKGITYPTYNSSLQLLGQTFLSSIKPVFTFDHRFSRVGVFSTHPLSPTFLSPSLPLGIFLAFRSGKTWSLFSDNKNNTGRYFFCFHLVSFRRGVIGSKIARTKRLPRIEQKRRHGSRHPRDDISPRRS